MTRLSDDDPATVPPPVGKTVETVIVPRARDIGGFEVRRALPAIERRMVGPFVFFDEMGPATLAAGSGLDVRPHPHIGLATVTWLTDGEILHRDTLGSIQPIRPGELNWMTAGRGIAHSERSPEAARRAPQYVAGLQAWVALPKQHEETAPTFTHYGAPSLPVIEADGARLVLIAGHGWGARSPVAVFSDTIYAEVTLAPGARLPIGAEHEERAIYILSGKVRIGGDTFTGGRLLVLRPGDAIAVSSETGARFMVLGGETMDGPRHLWWNFVSSSKERIEQAKADWKEGHFPKVVDDNEFIPLPE
ncbi:MAG: pirin family protein [Rhodospirillaceae bacterium]|nr:pirin family protein [Rhodospirillaceae bacterium]